MNPPAPVPDPVSRRLWLAIGVPLMILVVVVAVLAAAARIEFARREDAAYRVMSQRLVASAVDAREQALKDLVLDYANWDDAHDAITRRWDLRWLANNYYSSVFDALIVFRGGQMRYVWVAERLQEQRGALARDAMAAGRSLPGLESLPQASAIADMTASTRIAFDQTVALVAVAPVTREDYAARLQSRSGNAPTDFVLGVKVLDHSEIAALGQALGLEDFRFGVNAAAAPTDLSMPLAAPRGLGEGAFFWRDERPGGADIPRRLWVAVLVMLGLGAIATVATHASVMHALRRAAKAAA
jgi:CHASE4 domain